jgi:hypothetical protein
MWPDPFSSNIEEVLTRVALLAGSGSKAWSGNPDSLRYSLLPYWNTTRYRKLKSSKSVSISRLEHQCSIGKVCCIFGQCVNHE